MHEYEIRVLSSGHAALIVAEIYLNDQAAIRSARKFAGDRPFEVWRGVDCIYPPAAAAQTAADQGAHRSGSGGTAL